MGVKVAQVIRSVLACALLMVMIPHAIAQPDGLDTGERAARTQVERLRDNVVRVLVVAADGQVRRQGWGLMVGRDSNDLYVATPFHVVQDRDRQPTDRIEVQFRTAQGNLAPATTLDSSAVSSPIYLDLAVVLVPGAAGRAPGPAPAVALTRSDGGAWSWTIGRQESWELSGIHGGFAGPRVDPERLVFDNLRTPPGTSGQAVATADGIVGMVTNDGGDLETWAVAVTRIIERFRAAGHPVNLLTLTAPGGSAANRPLPPASEQGAGLPGAMIRRALANRDIIDALVTKKELWLLVSEPAEGPSFMNPSGGQFPTRQMSVVQILSDQTVVVCPFAKVPVGHGTIYFDGSNLRVFLNYKVDSVSYAMAGAIYDFGLLPLHETGATPLFAGRNWGWYPVFADGKIRHFSYEGYYYVLNSEKSSPVSPAQAQAAFKVYEANKTDGLLPSSDNSALVEAIVKMTENAAFR
jgi:hypothetical protein